MQKFNQTLMAAAILCLPLTVQAYVGPGAGLTMLGSLWGLIVAVVFVLVGILILPIKLLRNKRRRAREAAENAQRENAEEQVQSQPHPDDGDSAKTQV